MNKTIARKLAKEYNINLNVIDLDEFLFGLKVELEHRDITKGYYNLTTKIVIAHLKEDPRYYYYLRKMEHNRETYWKNKVKPNIFKD